MEKIDKKIILDYPITITDVDGESTEISTVELYRIKIKHLRSLPKDLLERLSEQGDNASLSIDEAIPILLAVTSLKDNEIDELDLIDFKKIQEALSGGDFLS
jgi:hypothetical protein